MYREVAGVRGFTRETLSALMVNIESREWRRDTNKSSGIPPEHPRASTTDDVECFFSILRDMVGKDFTHKQVRYITEHHWVSFKVAHNIKLQVMFSWRKACVELTKRLDPQLPFYYHTSTHHRFFEGDLPDFSVPSNKQRKEHVARRELMTSRIGGRVSMAQHGASSIRTQYHNVPVDLPPPPNISAHLIDHSY